MTKQVRIYLSDEVHSQAKAQAALAGITLAAWIESAISEKAQHAPAAVKSASTKKGGKTSK